MVSIVVRRETSVADGRVLQRGLDRLAPMPAPHPMQGHVSALAMTLGAKVDLVAGDVGAARERLVEGYRVGVATKDMPVVAGVGVGVAMFAAALERPLDAAEIVGAAARLRGADDRSSPDVIALRANVVTQVGAPTFESAYSRGRSMDRETRSPGLDPALPEH